MAFVFFDVLFMGLLFGGMLALQEVGLRIGERHRRRHHAAEKKTGSAAEGAVYGLLGLLLAFTFSGAGGRFDERRHLVVEEANAIGTAWLRIDLLPETAQPAMRGLFRRYMDARLERYRLFHDAAAGEAARMRSVRLQEEIWSAAVSAAKQSGEIAPLTVFLPALNSMIDITATREAATRLHPPVAVFVMVVLLCLVGSLFAGYGMAGAPRTWVHTFGFATVMSLALFVTLDLEFPRFGLIRVDYADAFSSTCGAR